MLCPIIPIPPPKDAPLKKLFVITSYSIHYTKLYETKLIIFSSVLLSLVLILQVVFNMFYSKNAFISDQKNQIEKLFYEIKNNYSDENESLFDLTQKADETNNIAILILDDEAVIYSSKNTMSFIMPFQKQQLTGLFKDDFTELPSAEILENERDDKSSIILKGKFEFEGETRYVMLMSHLESIDYSTLLFTKSNAVIAIIFIFIGIIVSVLFAKKLFKPIKDIENVANNISDLNFDSYANENTKTIEMNNLAVSVNKMSNKLQAYISDLQLANQRLLADIDYQKQAEQMRREFVANVSHEMKTPLCLLLLYTSGLKNNIESIDKDYYCDTIIEEVAKLDEMVKSMLDISAIENGLSKMSMERFDFSEFCTIISSKMSVLIKDYNSHYDFMQGLFVMGDKYYLEQSIKNYINNAISHTENGNDVITSYSIHYTKLYDKIDKGIKKKIRARFLLPFIKKEYKKAAHQYPELASTIEYEMENQFIIEKEGCSNIDKAGEPTANIMKAIAGEISDNPEQKRILERFGYLLGRYIFVITSYSIHYTKLYDAAKHN